VLSVSGRKTMHLYQTRELPGSREVGPKMKKGNTETISSFEKSKSKMISFYWNWAFLSRPGSIMDPWSKHCS